MTKAAQQLYIHRNTLQYRLDKWEELTGLQLKELTDLSLCYHIILKDLILMFCAACTKHFFILGSLP